MKAYARIVLLIALLLLMTLTACTRSAATRTPAAQPTSAGEAPFPFTTPNAGGVTDLGTQTAIAMTPQVILATNTPAPGEQPAAANPTSAPVGQGGGQPEGQESGGGVVQPTAQPQQPAPVAAGNLSAIQRPATYTIQKGDHPYCIARRYNLDIGSLLSANGLGNNSVVSIGTTLVIPATGEWNPAHGSRALQAHPTTYVVSASDSLNGIACKFGDVYPQHILEANGLGSAADVQSGITLNIP